jgi:hypothetical protein
MDIYRLRVREDILPRRIFGPKGEEGEEDLRKFYNDELHNLYSSPNIIRLIKSRREERVEE